MGGKSSNIKNDDFSQKFAWIFTQSDYTQLRKSQGCGSLICLPQTKNDEANALKIAQRMAIPSHNVILFRDMDYKTITDKVKTQSQKIIGHCAKNEKVLLFVYCAGHGV